MLKNLNIMRLSYDMNMITCISSLCMEVTCEYLGKLNLDSHRDTNNSSICNSDTQKYNNPTFHSVGTSIPPALSHLYYANPTMPNTQKQMIHHSISEPLTTHATHIISATTNTHRPLRKFPHKLLQSGRPGRVL